jgi:hypothetical protein
MRLSKDWADFTHKLNAYYPRFGDTFEFAYDFNDDGKGL